MLELRLGPPGDPRPELQMCVGRGLDQTIAPSTTPISYTLADVDLLPEPVSLLAARPGSGRSRMDSRNILLKVEQ